MKKKLELLKNKWLLAIPITVVAIVVAVIVYVNTRVSISFSDDMPKTAPVNQVLDITQYINNPNDEILVLSAEYEKDGVTNQYAVAGLSFKPKHTGEVKLTVTISGTKKHIDTSIEIVEAAPVFVSAEEANYYVGQTIQLKELLDYIVYDSKSTPELIVNKVEYGANKLELTDVKEFTFEEIADYIFYVEIKNSGGSASGIVKAHVTKELTPNEENDLTNTIRLINDTHAAIEISEDDHAENSDWAWEITANAADVYEEGNRNFFLNVVYIDFGKEIDTAKEFFSMDVKVSEDANGFRFNLMDSAGDLHEVAKDYNDIKGEWFSVSSEDLYDVGYYTGMFITIMHPRGVDKVGTYDVTNVKAIVDNCFLHDRGDVKPITNKIVSAGSGAGTATLTSPIAGNIQYASHLHMQGNYTEECFEFTTTIQDKWNPNLVIGARLDNVTKNVEESTGLILNFRANEKENNQYVAIYSPKYHGANHVQSAAGYKFVNGEQYTFIVKVTNTGNGKSTVSLRIMTADNETILMFTSKEISGVPTKGSFAVWNLDKERTVSYKMPYAEKQNVNKIVASNGSAGVATLESAYPGVYTNSATDASYLQMQGSYAEECFEFTTKITAQKENIPNLLIGARLNQVNSNMYDSEGLIVSVFNDRVAYYAPYYHGQNHKGSFGFSGFKLENEKEYTFIVQVSTESDGTEILNLTIKDGDKVLGIYSHTTNLASKGKMNVADKGSFAVWSLDASKEITYKMPYKVPTNTNVAIPAKGSSGKATLKSVYEGLTENASYLQMQGNYTDECFEFTTVIQDKWNPNLVIGARVTEAKENITQCKGVIIDVRANEAERNQYIAIYTPGYNGKSHVESTTGYNLESGREYTFIVRVVENKGGKSVVELTIKQGDNLVHTYITSTAKAFNAPSAKGSFVVWNLNKEASIQYKMPYEKPVNVNKIVTATEGDGSATLTTINPGTMTSSATDASYLEMQGNYTEEKFAFTTKVTEAANSDIPSLLIGARLDQVTANMYESNGIVIAVFNNRLAYYAPAYRGANHKGSFGFSGYTLENNKEYTFVIQVDTLDDHSEILNLTIKDGKTVLGTYSHTANLASKGAIDVAESGSFAVWNLDATREISYKQPRAAYASYSVQEIVNGKDTTYSEAKTGLSFTLNATPDVAQNVEFTKTEESQVLYNGVEVSDYYFSRVDDNFVLGVKSLYNTDSTAKNMPDEGDVITISGVFETLKNGVKGFELNAYEFTYVGELWTWRTHTVSNITNGNINISGGLQNEFLFKFTVNPNTPRDLHLESDGNHKVVYNGEELKANEYGFYKVNEDGRYVLGVANALKTPVKGDTLMISGAFEAVKDSVTYGLVVKEQTFYFDGTGWTLEYVEADPVVPDQGGENENKTVVTKISGVRIASNTDSNGFEAKSSSEYYLWLNVDKTTLNADLGYTSGGFSDNFKVLLAGEEIDCKLRVFNNNMAIVLPASLFNAVKDTKGASIEIAKGTTVSSSIADTKMLEFAEEFKYVNINGTMWQINGEVTEEKPANHINVTVSGPKNNHSYGWQQRTDLHGWYLWLDLTVADGSALNTVLGVSEGATSNVFQVLVNGEWKNVEFRIWGNYGILVLRNAHISNIETTIPTEGTTIMIPEGTVISWTGAEKRVEFTQTFSYHNTDGTVWEVITPSARPENVKLSVGAPKTNYEYGWQQRTDLHGWYLWLDLTAANGTALNTALDIGAGTTSNVFQVLVNNEWKSVEFRVWGNYGILVLRNAHISNIETSLPTKGTTITIPKGTVVTYAGAERKLEFTEDFTYENTDGTVWQVVE